MSAIDKLFTAGPLSHVAVSATSVPTQLNAEGEVLLYDHTEKP